jgi:hypothetical protein
MAKPSQSGRQLFRFTTQATVAVPAPICQLRAGSSHHFELGAEDGPALERLAALVKGKQITAETLDEAGAATPWPPETEKPAEK